MTAAYGNPVTAMMNRPCVVHRRAAGPRDAYGDQTAVETVMVARCELQQIAATDDAAGPGSSVRAHAYLPPEVPVTGWDWLEVDGGRYEVDGDPWVVRDPLTGRDSHVEAVLIRTR